MKNALIYLRRYFWQYFLTALAFAVITAGFTRLVADSVRQSSAIAFFRQIPYDLIVPKGTSLESLLFLQDLRQNEPEGFIPANLYATLREAPQLRLIPLVKESSGPDEVRLATDLSDFDLNSRLAFLKRGGLVLKAVPLAENTKSDPLWGTSVVNLILVEGPFSERAKLRDLVQKKTVAEYVSIEEKTDQILQLLGWTGKKIAANWFVFLSLLTAVLVSVALAIRPLWIEISTVLRRYGFSRAAVLAPLLFPLLVIYAGMAAVLISFL